MPEERKSQEVLVCGVHNTFEVRVYKNNKQFDYQLSADNHGKIWITNQDGEGGEFDGVKFFEMLDKFFKENY